MKFRHRRLCFLDCFCLWGSGIHGLGFRVQALTLLEVSSELQIQNFLCCARRALFHYVRNMRTSTLKLHRSPKPGLLENGAHEILCTMTLLETPQNPKSSLRYLERPFKSSMRQLKDTLFLTLQTLNPKPYFFAPLWKPLAQNSKPQISKLRRSFLEFLCMTVP